MFSDGGNGTGGQEEITLAREALVDEIVVRYDRADGTMFIGGHVCNNDTALDMLQRAARHYETVLRLEAAARIRAEAMDAAQTAQILERTRGGRQ